MSDADFQELMMHNSNSYASRKNPGAAIDAFREAYGDNPEKVKLVIKISNPKPEDLEFVEKKLVPGSYILMTDRLERKQLNSLIRLCDVFLSLHRSEGFGLVMAEAMNLGTAAVATHWSANAEFMPEGTACNVSSRQIPVGDAYQDAPEGLTWADADVHEAAGYLRRLKEDPAYREEITRAGQAYIREQLSVAACTEKISKRLDEIIQNSEFRIQN
jgi:glycosyltransferase involved in cell wall biosynthesis